MISGEGAPPVGPMDVVVEGDTIVSLHQVGYPGVPIEEASRPAVREGDTVLELEGHYLLPGFIDLHAHFGGDAQGVPAEYPAKLWLAHGITTIREPGSFNGLDWVKAAPKTGSRRRASSPTSASAWAVTNRYSAPKRRVNGCEISPARAPPGSSFSALRRR